MLPNPQHTPPGGPQLLLYQPVAQRISCQFPLPKGSIRSRLGAMKRARVPEASVHEDGKPFLWKNKVGMAEKEGVAPPTFDSCLSQQR
jgi:hypothetical protein